MRLTVIGSGTSVPSAERGSPCFLVRLPGVTALVDSGSGSLRTLARLGIEPADLTDLLYTHAHLDHTADLWPLLFVSGNRIARRHPARLRIHGSPEFFAFYDRVASAFGAWVVPEGPILERLVHRGGPVALGTRAAATSVEVATVTASRVPHIASSVAYRIELHGRSVVFSGDTDDGEAIVEAARGADLLVLECSTPDTEKVEGHLTPALCGRIAQAASARRLLLTHFYPALDGVDIVSIVRAAYGGEVMLAQDLQELEV